MKTLHQTLSLALGTLALAGTAFSQVPSTNDTSDTNENTGMGTGALSGPNLTGCCNTASGYQALYNNTTGGGNTATGNGAVLNNTTGGGNTATGIAALLNNTTGSDNTAFGDQALGSNRTGSANTAAGSDALLYNTTGHHNTASGIVALYNNTTGSFNAASGSQALFYNTTGSYNAASCSFALYYNTTGSNNIVEGYQAGYNLTTGSNNIDIGNKGLAADGEVADSGVIRIGTSSPTQLQRATYIAGIYNVPISGNAVVVTSTGQLGVAAVSSERFKTGIAPMGSNSAKLEQLRPVIFKLKSDAKGTRQYGLIAEEVAKIYPELVIRDEKGRIDGVRYDELAPMLLNEVQKQDAKIRELEQQQVRDRATAISGTKKSRARTARGTRQAAREG